MGSASVAGFQELDEAGIGVGGGRQVVGEQLGVDFRHLAGTPIVLDRVDEHEATDQHDERQRRGDLPPQATMAGTVSTLRLASACTRAARSRSVT
jgi:hypothetical protein